MQFYEFKETQERVILIGVQTEVGDDVEASLDELEELAETAGAETVAKVIQNREAVHPGTYIGKGKIEEVASLLRALDANGVICDDELSPAQLNNLERELDGTPIKGYAPQDTIRMKVQGGGENYVHGGISLQELVVPVIAFKNLRTSNKNYVEVKNAELKLLSESRKISNLIFSLEFHQRQPVGDKIQPCTYSIYMTDDEGVVISDRQTVIADKTSDNAADRVFRVRFNLKAGTYDKKKVYRLVIANEIDVEEIEFHIDIAFADDFGFDL